MTDLLDPLHTLGEDPSVQPLPAAVVRRAGDRLRRRRHLFQAGGSALAVTVIAAGGFALGNGGLSSPPQPAPAPSPTATPTSSETPSDVAPPDGWVVKASERVPLDHGYPRVGDGEVLGPARNVIAFDRVEACGEPFALVADPTDDWAATYTGPEDIRARRLLVHGSAAAAQQNLFRLVDLYRRCPADGSASHEVVRSRLGDEAWRILTTYRTEGDLPALGQEVLVAVRIGNALLLASEYGEGPGSTDPAAARALADAVEADQEPVLRDLCRFSLDPCGSPAETTTQYPELSLGPLGAAGIELGMSLAEASAAPGVTPPVTGSSCPNLQTEDGLVVSVSPRYGVVFLSASGPAHTPEGVGTGSSRREVEQALGPLDRYYDSWSAPVPSRPDRVYVFAFDGGRVSHLSLHALAQDCAG